MMNPVQIACFKGFTEIIKVLKDDFKSDDYNLICYSGSVECLQSILQFNQQDFKIDMNEIIFDILKRKN